MFNNLFFPITLPSTHRGTLLAILLTITANSSYATIISGDLLITELMANPAAVSDSKGEWFEIWNASDHSLDLNGINISDNGSNSFNVSESITLNAGEYFVFGRNGDSTNNGGFVSDYTYSSFTLSNSSDAIIIEFGNVIIDSLIYDDSALFAVAGNSVERVADTFVLTSDSLTYGDGDIGTPGNAGSDLVVSTVPEPSTVWLMASALVGLIIRRKTDH